MTGLLLAGLVALAPLHGLAQTANPPGATGAPPLVTADKHVVCRGDTLWDIARRSPAAAGDWRTLQQRNGVAVPELLQPGKVLTLSQAAESERKKLKSSGVNEATAIAASVVELTGTAWITRGKAAQQPLAAGMPVQANDLLVTDRGTFLSLGLADGSRIVMPSSSAVRVVAADGCLTRLELLKGRLESHVEKQNGRQFEVRTRTAGLGVRGTHFRARDEDGVIVAEVIEGGVQVVQVGPVAQTGDEPHSVLLQAGQGVLLSTSAALAPEPLLPPPQWATGPDGTTLRIEPVTGATGYRLQLARDERFFQLVLEARNKAPEFTLPGGLEAAFYYIRVTAFDALQIEGLPGERAIYLAPNGETRSTSSALMADGRVDVRWPAQRGLRYSFELSRATDFDPVLVQEASVFDGVTVGPFSVPGTYYWRSRAVEDAGKAATTGFQGSFDIPPAR